MKKNISKGVTKRGQKIKNENIYFLFNNDGVRLCGHIGCDVSKKLRPVYGDLFCESHILEHSELYSRLLLFKQMTPQKRLKYRRQEINVRMSDVLMRKNITDGHVQFVFNLYTQELKDMVNARQKFINDVSIKSSSEDN